MIDGTSVKSAAENYKFDKDSDQYLIYILFKLLSALSILIIVLVLIIEFVKKKITYKHSL